MSSFLDTFRKLTNVTVYTIKKEQINLFNVELCPVSASLVVTTLIIA